MSEIRVASRYAKSLLELAQEKNILEDVYQDMELFSKTVNDNRELLLVLKNPIIHADKKLAILTALFQKRVSNITMIFFELVIKKNRERYLTEVADQFVAQYNDIKGNIPATVTTTFPLNDGLRTQFRTLIKEATGKDAHLKEEINPDIIGGFVLKMGDKQVDESIRAKIEELKANLIDKSYIKTI
jgi:F-type H+-transporting ATPase subunit delta